MQAKWAVVLAFLGSSALAVVVAALALGRGDLPTVTYLVYTSDEQPLPRGGIVETRGGERVWLRFEALEDEQQVARRAGELPGVILDAGTYRELSRESLREWRHSGAVLVVFGVDPAQVAMELEVDAQGPPPSGSASSFVLLGGTDSIIGDPASIDRSRPFVGMSYRPPGGGETELGKLGWFQDDDDGARTWLVGFALQAASDYERPLN